LNYIAKNKFSPRALCLQFVLLLFWGINCLALAKGEAKAFTNGSVNVEIGIWKPSSIDDNPTKPFKNIAGAQKTYGFAVMSPSWANLAIRLSLFQWQQKNLSQAFESVTLRHLSFDIKYSIVNNLKLSPFVTYGGAAIFGRERGTGSAVQSVFSHVGTGFNLGAGIDLLLMQHWGLGVEYQYLYAKMKQKIGLTDNYNGPKFSLKLLYLF
jgi:hypothetical protein